MEINHLIEFVSGPFETDTGEIKCVPHRKYGRVDLCLVGGGWNIPFARIKLHSKDLARDAEAVFDDAVRLGDEIVRRWNAAGCKRDGSTENAETGPLCSVCFAGIQRDSADTDCVSKRDDKYLANYWKHMARVRLESLDAWANGEWRKALGHATELFGEIMRDEVNHQDEAEKWLRAYGHLVPPGNDDLDIHNVTTLPPAEGGSTEATKR